MDNYIELKKSLHFIDRENDLATSKDLSKIDKQTKNNINEIISKVYHHENCREYIPQKASFVIEKILEITRDISLWNKYVDQFANKLLEKEITKQKEITKRFSNVTKPYWRCNFRVGRPGRSGDCRGRCCGLQHCHGGRHRRRQPGIVDRWHQCAVQSVSVVV